MRWFEHVARSLILALIIREFYDHDVKGHTAGFSAAVGSSHFSKRDENKLHGRGAAVLTARRSLGYL